MAVFANTMPPYRSRTISGPLPTPVLALAEEAPPGPALLGPFEDDARSDIDTRMRGSSGVPGKEALYGLAAVFLETRMRKAPHRCTLVSLAARTFRTDDHVHGNGPRILVDHVQVSGHRREYTTASANLRKDPACGTYT